MRRRRVVLGEGVGLHEVDAREVLVGREDVAEVLAGQLHEDRQTGAGAHEDGVVAHLEELVDGVEAADDRVDLDLDAEPPQVVDLGPDDGLGQTELGDAVDQHPAGLVQRLEHRHRVAFGDHVGGQGEAGRTGADHGDALAGRLGLAGDGHRVGLTLEVGREALEVADRHRLLLLAQHADLLALVVLGTDAAADRGQGVLLP